MADVAGSSSALGPVTINQTDNQRSPSSKFPEPPLVEVSELTVELEAWEDDLLILSGDEAGDIGEIREVVAPTALPMDPLELPDVSAEFSGSLNQDGLETPSSAMLFSPFLPGEDGLTAEGEGFLDGLAPLSAFHESEESPLAVPSDDLDELDAILFPTLPISIASSSNLSSPAALPPPQQCHPFHHREHPRYKHKHKYKSKYKHAHSLKQKHGQKLREAPVFRRDSAAARRALDRLLTDGGIYGKRARSARGTTRGGCDCGHDGRKNEGGAGEAALEVREVVEVGEIGEICVVGDCERRRSESRPFSVKREGGVAETLKFDRLELVESTLKPVVDRTGEPRNAATGATAANVVDVPNAANVADVTTGVIGAANGANGANDAPGATSGVDGRSNGGATSGAEDHLASRHPVDGSAAVVSPSNEKTAECHCRVEEGAICAGRNEDRKGANNKRPWSSPLVAYLLSPPSPRPAKRRSLPVIPAPSPISQGNSPGGFLSPGMETSVFRLHAAATSSAFAATPAPSAASADAPASPGAAAAGAFPSRRCSHCSTTTTPQWRTGPLGAKTLCNACGVRFKSGRLCPEYRPANSPGFSPKLHSNLHRKIVQMRERRSGEGGEGGCSAEDGVEAGELRRREVQGLRKIKKVKECVEGGTVEGGQGRSGNGGVAVAQEKIQERVQEKVQEKAQDQEKVQERVQEGLDEEVVVISPAIQPAMSPLSGCGKKHRKVDIVAARRADAQAAATRALQSAEGVVEVEQHAATVAHAVGAVGAGGSVGASGAAGAGSANAQAAATRTLQSAEGVVEVQQSEQSAASAVGAGAAGAASADAQAAVTRTLQSAEGIVGVQQLAGSVTGAASVAGASYAASAASAAGATGAASASYAFTAAGEGALPSGAAAVMGDSGTGGCVEKKKDDGSTSERSMTTAGGSASASAAMVSLQRSCSSGAHLTTNFVAASA